MDDRSKVRRAVAGAERPRPMPVRPRPPKGDRPKAAAKKRGRWRHPFRIERQGEGLVYLWHGMRWSTWMRLLADGRFDVSVNCLPRILSVTLMAPLVSASALASKALYRRRVAATAVRDPIFILGHWRTGTTLLHELLACDPRLAFPTTHQCLFPDTFLVSGRAFHAIYAMFMPTRRPFDDMPMGLDRPQEEEFGLVNMGVGSLYRAFAFPRHGPGDSRYLDLAGLSTDERGAWEAAYVTLLKRIQSTTPNRLVLKSPAHTARIATLMRLFPDARFIHIARDPREVFPSTVHMLKGLMAVQGLHNPPDIDGWVGEYVLSTFERMYAAYDRDCKLVPAGRLAEIRFEDLIADTTGVLSEVYEALDLGDFAVTEPAVDAYLADRAGHRRNKYALDEEERRAVVSRWRSYMERFNYAA